MAGSEPIWAQNPAILIESRNEASVPESVVANAAGRVRSIYEAAGVSATWADGIVEARTAPLILTVIIAHRTARKSVAEDAFGLAPEPDQGCGHIAYVFWDRVAEYAYKNRLDAAVVLAAVIAHETGHLVLPQSSHSASGVMAAHWRTNDFIYAKRGPIIGFTDTQVARIQAQIRNNCQ